MYTTLYFGSDRSLPIVFALDENADTATFYIDSNGNGDLTDDAAPVMWRQQDAEPERRPKLAVWRTYWYNGNAMAAYGGVKESLGIKFYIYSKADRERSKIDPVLLYYRDYYRTGSLDLGGKAYRFALIDDNTDGRYDSGPNAEIRFRGDTLLIDRDASGTFERGMEAYVISEPFNIGGTTYEVAKVAADGSKLEIRKSEKSVPERQPPPSLKVGDAPPALEGGKPFGNAIALDKYKGRVVLLDFWATWCGPCVAEMPAVKQLYEKYKSKGFEIVGISLDEPNDGPKMATFLQENKIGWPQIHDAARTISRRYYVSAIPATFLIGRDGRIIAVGLRDAELEKAVSDAIK